MQPGGTTDASYGRLASLLASTSLTAIIIAGGVPSAYAACNTSYTNTTSAGCTNSAAITGIAINNSTITSGITNSGTISPNGIVLSNGSTITGGISDTPTGTISGGISISGTSKISAAGSAVQVFGPLFAGGISNSGTISSAGLGIVIGTSADPVLTFSGGVTNSGTITAAKTGVKVSFVSTFSGGVGNSGTITAGQSGLNVTHVSMFSGGMTNSGKIASQSSNAMTALTIATFSGGMTNSGTISSKFQGMAAEDMTTFSGGVTNSGSISGRSGILVNGIAGFTGGIANNGQITVSGVTAKGIFVEQIGTFANGVSNGGTISSAGFGILVGVSGDPVSTFSGGVANSGTIIAANSGVVVSNVSVFSGGMTNSGTISSAGGSGMLAFTVSTFSGGMTNSGAIVARQWGMYAQTLSTFSGDILNSGTISAGTNGIAVVSVSTFLGGITNTGTISAAHGIVISNTTGVSVFDSGTIIGTTGFAINFSTGPNTLTLGPGFDIQGKVVGSGTDIFQLGGTGSGNFNLATIGPAQYEGFTTFNVVGGVWNTTGTFGQLQAWNVNGGTLAGTGTFQSVDVNAGSTLAPGTPGAPGTFMTINGGLAFASGAVYLATLNSTTASRANVANTASLAGIVSASVTGGLSHQTYDILHAGSVSGTFSGFSANNLSGTLTYTPTDVFLNLIANLGGGTALNVNQSNVATSINTFFNNGGALPPGFGSIFGLTGASLGNALTQLDGEAAADAGKGAFQLMTDFLDLMLDPTAGGGGNVSGGAATGFAPEQDTSLPADVALAYAKALRKPAPQTPSPANFDQRWTAWGSAFGGTSWTKGDAAIGSNNVNASDYGFAAGMESHVSPNFTYGFALAGGGTNWNLAQGLGSGRSDAFQAGLYAKTHAGPAYLSAAVAFANHWFTTDRIALSDQLRASFTGQSYAARVEGGYRYAVPITGAIVGVTPYAALQAQDFHTPSYSETDLGGGGFGLSYNSMNATDTRSELGARFDNLQIVNNMPLVLRGRLAWAHDWYTNATALNAAFQTLPGSTFTVNGAAPPKNSALTTAAAELHITSNWTAIAKFDGDFGSGSQTYGGTGTLRYSW